MHNLQASTSFSQEPEMDPLKSALEELASTEASRMPSQLRTEGRGQSELISILLGLVDETVLPRQMSVESEGINLGEFTVSHRRLTAISLAGSADQNFFKPPSDPDFAVRHYAMCIRAMAALLGDNAFRIKIAACDNSSDMVSCSVRRLEQVLRPDAQGSRLAAFLQDIQGSSLAWLLQEKDDPDATIAGDERMSQLLVAFAGMQQAARPCSRNDVPVLPGQYSCSVLSLNSTITVLWLCEGQSSALVAMTVEHAQAAMQQLNHYMAVGA